MCLCLCSRPKDLLHPKKAVITERGELRRARHGYEDGKVKVEWRMWRVKVFGATKMGCWLGRGEGQDRRLAQRVRFIDPTHPYALCVLIECWKRDRKKKKGNGSALHIVIVFRKSDFHGIASCGIPLAQWKGDSQKSEERGWSMHAHVEKKLEKKKAKKIISVSCHDHEVSSRISLVWSSCFCFPHPIPLPSHIKAFSVDSSKMRNERGLWNGFSLQLLCKIGNVCEIGNVQERF